MSQSEHDQRVDYVEFPATDIPATKRFYNAVFGWKFDDYGPDYIGFHDGRLGGGFYKAPHAGPGGALVVIYAADMEATQARVVQAGGKILRPTFDFPGGRRFHFSDPSGNELSVWSEQVGHS